MKIQKKWILLATVLIVPLGLITISQTRSHPHLFPLESATIPNVTQFTPIPAAAPVPAPNIIPQSRLSAHQANVSNVLSRQNIPAKYSYRFLSLQPAQIKALGYITEEQTKIVQGIYDRVVRDRLALEGELATSKVVSDTQIFIEIPAYAQSRDLEAEFYKEIGASISTITAQKIRISLGVSLGSENAGFGAKPQELLVTAIDSTSWKIVHTISTSGGSTLTKVNQVTPNRLDSYAVLAALFPRLPSKNNQNMKTRFIRFVFCFFSLAGLRLGAQIGWAGVSSYYRGSRRLTTL